MANDKRNTAPNREAMGWAIGGMFLGLLTIVMFTLSPNWYLVLGSCIVAVAGAAMVARAIAALRRTVDGSGTM
ncbi:hypothetical protein [Arthrobacter monumenti]